MIIIFLLIGWSITSILVNGIIFNSLRNYTIVKLPKLSNLMTCMQCSGFWVGVLLGLLSVFNITINPICELFNMKIGNSFFIDILVLFFYGTLNSGVSVIINSLLIYFSRKD